MLIDFQQVEICQKDHQVLTEVNLQVDKGEFIYIIGKVGTGKSSLLKSLYCELPIKNGEASVLDFNLKTIKQREVPALRRELGIVFQDFQLLVDRTVYENLEFVLEATGWKNEPQKEERIAEVLRLVGMTGKEYQKPFELSGGEQQRIVIARSLLNAPKLILADEPTGNLDPETGKQIIELLYQISKKGTSVLITTHNLQLLKEFPGKVYTCEKGKLIGTGKRI